MKDDQLPIKPRVRRLTFGIPWLLLVTVVAISLISGEIFVKGLDVTTALVLDNFAWLFNWSTLALVVVVIYVYFSPLGRVKLGGKNVKPVIKLTSLTWITLCTTIAAGILFWACAEPLFHYHAPSEMSGVEAGTPGASLFAMKTMFLEWTWTPYAIYTSATIALGFAFYNMKLEGSVAAGLAPLFGDRVMRWRTVIDILCLFALGAGMAASLGTGTITIAGGVENMFGIESAPPSWAVVIVLIVATFVVSSVTGIMRGIRVLSDINVRVYFVILVFVVIFGPHVFMLNFSTEAWGVYARDFLTSSLANGAAFGDSWDKSWPIFYWCNWYAWTPVTAVFLASISKGYEIRRVIQVNFIIPSMFATIWMGVFSSSTLYYEIQGVGMWEALQERGPESVVYALFEQLPVSSIVIPLYLFIVFISFVTASDSNTSAAASLCCDGIDSEKQNAPASVKILWGVTIGVVTWVLISFAGIDGIKAASNLGGFPNMFFMILLGAGLVKIARNPEKYDKTLVYEPVEELRE